MKNHLIITVIACLLVGGIAFYGGQTYASGKSSTEAQGQGFQRGNRQGGQGGNFQFRGGNGGPTGFTNGQVLSKDDKSITLQMRDGGSRIVFYTASTKTSKQVDGTMDDVAVGKNVTVIGDANSDGSITAQQIQLRPDMPFGNASSTK